MIFTILFTCIDNINMQVIFFFYRVLGQSDVSRSSVLHDSQRLGQITPTPVEGHSLKDSVYAF